MSLKTYFFNADIKEYFFRINEAYNAGCNLFINNLINLSNDAGREDIKSMFMTGHPFLGLFAIGMYKTQKLTAKIIKKSKNLEQKV